MAEKFDFKKELASYKGKHHKFELIEVPAMQYLMIDGHGDPNAAPEFTAAVEALYPLAYKLKFMSKQALGRDYTVMPLEGLWWSDDMATFTSARDKSAWDWTLMIMQPEWITPAMFDGALKIVKAKPGTSPSVSDVRLGTLKEGLCVQTLHIGSYDDETEILAELHDQYVPQRNLKMTGKHHEVYLSDARKTAPEKLRTILRQPVIQA